MTRGLWRSVRKVALLCIVLAVPVLAADQALADACDTSANPVVINSSCDDFVIGGVKSDVTIEQPATLSPFFGNEGALINNSGIVTGVFLNQGTITSGFGSDGLVNQGTITALQNDGTITSGSSSGDHAAIANGGEIGALLNNGIISATVGNFGSGAHAILQVGHIGTLENYGTISAQNSAIYFEPAFTRRIDTLINVGTIAGGINGGGTNTFASAIVLGPASSIGTIINTGTIDHSVCQGGTCYAAIENNGGSIDTITNLGRLTSGNTGDDGFGIINGVTGRIGTLNNDQEDLKYYGTLPSNYLAIIYGPSNYARMAVSNASGVMSFGVDAAAPIGTSTYANVLSGIDEGNLATTSGSWGGGLFNNTWVLSSGAPSQWDLTLTSQPIVPSVESSAGEKLADAIVTTVTYYASGEAPPGTIAPVLVNGVTLQQAAQAITPTQAQQFSDVNAEGYSSNLTIGLQQMGMISDAVMDRIHSQPSGSQEVEPSRHIWVDGSATRGKVNGYDGLSGFDYDLYNIVVGGDLLRTSTGGIGVFAGYGYSRMSESEYVPQDFSTNNYFAGLYGGHDFASDVRLSGSVGYIYGRNEASRNNASIGQFTGGKAESDYSSNGAFGALKLSKSIMVSEATVTPFIGASYSQLWMDQAKESGGGDFNYTISDATAYTTVAFVGGEFIAPVSLAGSDGLAVVGFARVGYDFFADDDGAHSVTAASSTFGSFEQVGADMGPVVSAMGLGIQGGSADGLSGRLGAVAALNSNGYQFGLGGELRW
jgi:uncharacterized protein with beta-barrel porin domain